MCGCEKNVLENTNYHEPKWRHTNISILLLK